MLALTAPAAVTPQQLAAEIAAAGYRDIQVALTERTVGNVHVEGWRSDSTPIGEDDRAALQEVVDAHTPKPPEVLPVVNALKAATTLGQVKAALVTHFGG
jgi:hypothetical protein